MSECVSHGGDCATRRTAVRGTKRRANAVVLVSDSNSEPAVKSCKVSSSELLVNSYVEVKESTQRQSSVSTAESDRDVVKILKEKLKDVVTLEDRLSDGPVLVALLADGVWESYCELEDKDQVPLELRFLHEENGELYIIELPTQIHEHYALRILIQLTRACEYLTSLGAGTVTHKQADQFILPLPNCPNAVIPAVSRNCATVIVEVGVSQGWAGNGGLDMKAQHWFVTQTALEYIVCVRIVKHRVTRQVTSLTYKVYDIAACNGVFPLNNPATSFTVGNNHDIVLDAHRVLRIPANAQLPAGCPAQFVINLVEIRASSFAFGL